MKVSSRVAWALTHGEPGDLHVCHKCDNPRCCNPSHLFLGTPGDNARDRDGKGRRRKGVVGIPGERNARAKLSDVQVDQIRSEYVKGDVSQSELARKHNVSRQNVHWIVHGITWGHRSED